MAMQRIFNVVLVFVMFAFLSCSNSSGDTGVTAPFIDTDGDGIVDNMDNCVNNANADQSDLDSDGIGDVCDPINNNISPPSAPSTLSAFSSLNNCEIAISWIDNSSNEDEFVLVRMFDFQSGPSGLSTTINIPASSGTGTVNYTDTIGVGSINVSYVVRATNAGGDSANSSASSTIALPNCM